MATAPRGSFSNANRHMQEEETLQLTSVGVDIGSSTSHLVFSRLELTLEGSRYRVSKREVINESQILLTPYVDDTRIDVEALEKFINDQYTAAKIRREEVDTGALILTGVAVQTAQRPRHRRTVRPGSGKIRRRQRRRRTRSDHGGAWLRRGGPLGENGRRGFKYRHRRRHQQIRRLQQRQSSGSLRHRRRRSLARFRPRRRHRAYRRSRAKTCGLGRFFCRARQKNPGRRSAQNGFRHDGQAVRHAEPRCDHRRHQRLAAPAAAHLQGRDRLRDVFRRGVGVHL